MVYRDPDTGQFVSDGGTPARYSDYEFQHVVSDYTVPASDLPEAFPINETDINAVDMDDLIHRDERAELVAVIVHSLQASIPGTSSAESALYARWELGIGNGSFSIDPADGDTTTDVNGSVVNKTVFNSDDPSILYSAAWNADAGFADSSTGTGGGADQPVLQQDVHYPRDYGSCPTLDTRDEITESMALTDRGGATIEDSLIQVTASYTLVFSVEEHQH